MKRALLFTFFSLSAVMLFAQPANDNCADAIVALEGETTDFTTLTATTDGPFHVDTPCPSALNDTIFRDIWYTFTPDFTGIADWSLCGTADFDTKIAVYLPGSACPPLDEDLISCNEDATSCANATSRLYFSVVAGETYLLRLGGYGETAPGQGGPGTFTIEEFITTLTNDFCAQATTVMLGEEQEFSNIGAITDGPAHPNDPGCFGFGDNSVQADIWYTFTAPNTGTIEWATCDMINFDSRLAVYNPGASCPPVDEDLYECNDDGSGCSDFTSRVIFDVVAGETYLLRLGGFNGEQGMGTFDLIETEPPIPPANDFCENADSAWVISSEQFDQLEGAVEGSTVNGTIGALSEFIFPNGQCYTANTTSGEFSTVWFKLNTLGNDSLTFWLFKQEGSEEASFILEMFETCDTQVDSIALMGSCVVATSMESLVFTTVTGMPSEPTEYLLRVTTRLTTELPGDFFMFIVGVLPDPPVGTTEPFADQIDLFPNPVNDQLTLNFHLNERAVTDIKLVNTLGQTVLLNQQQTLHAGDHQLNFDLSDLADGLYFLVMESEKGRSTKRVVK